MTNLPDSKVKGQHGGPSGADRTQVGPHVSPINLAIWVTTVAANNLATQDVTVATAMKLT